MTIKITGLDKLRAFADRVETAAKAAVENSVKEIAADLEADIHKYDAQQALAYRLSKIRDRDYSDEEPKE